VIVKLKTGTDNVANNGSNQLASPPS